MMSASSFQQFPYLEPLAVRMCMFVMPVIVAVVVVVVPEMKVIGVGVFPGLFLYVGVDGSVSCGLRS
jgi:hypothetical protein